MTPVSGAGRSIKKVSAPRRANRAVPAQVVDLAALAKPEGNAVARVLHAIRAHLDMDVAFVAEFRGDHRIFRHVDARSEGAPIKAGDSLPLSEGYCQGVVAGDLPQLIPDTARDPRASAIAATAQVPIGAHLSVPLVLNDGSVYGTFCCFNYKANRSLNGRDLQIMRAFADLVAHQIDVDRSASRGQDTLTTRVRALLSANQPAIVYQPVFRLADQSIIGAEALARFQAEPTRSPDVYFAEAGQVGLQGELELAAIRNAVRFYQPVRQRGAYYLALNASPQTIVGGGVAEAIRDMPVEQVVLEVTEHSYVEDYDAMMRALAPMRARGLRVAIDDAGSGYASMRHVLNIAPDFIKLDISLTRGIDSDRVRRALAAALISFGRQTECKIIAEGVETETELRTLRDLGVYAAQGYRLSRPIPVEDFLRLLP